MATVISSTEKKTFTGSCHCKKIQFTANVTTPLKVTRCNCTICGKAGFTSMSLDPSDFTLISPASQDELSDYHANGRDNNIQHFCPTCGAKLSMRAEYEYKGQAMKDFAINAALLDQPQDGLDLSEVKIKYFDGLHDNWEIELTDTPASGGLV